MEQQKSATSELKQDILDIVSKCVKCRFCFSKCPVYEVSDGWMTQGASGITQSLYYGIKLDKINKDLRDILVQCTTCRNCEILCERLMAGVSLVDAIIKGRQLALEEGINPVKQQQTALESLQLRGNPYGKAPAKRTAWAEDLGVNIIDSEQNEIETLLFVGCTPSYDERIQKVSRTIASILRTAGIKFGILKHEQCAGDPARVLGETDLFDLLAQKNIELFNAAKIKQIITISPHDFHCLKSEYPQKMQEIHIEHYTEFFARMVKEKKINFPYGYDRKVTYHDPCYLGKHHQIYEAPRKILTAIPGLEFLEMERNRDDSLCCGGGGGRMWTDIDENEHLAEVRVKEALSTGAQVIATACPFCLIHFEDAIKTLKKEKDICVLDISEIIFAAAIEKL